MSVERVEALAGVADDGEVDGIGSAADALVSLRGIFSMEVGFHTGSVLLTSYRRCNQEE